MKVDKSFVDDVGESAESGALAEAIVQLGNTLHLQTVAEGIEQAHQVDELRAFGCQFGQGFYFAKPLRREQIDELLSRLPATSPRRAPPPRTRRPCVEHELSVCARRDIHQRSRRPASHRRWSVETQRWADLDRLRASHPMMDAVIDEVRGRKIRIGDHWLCDFASCNYLGFDLHPEIIESVERELWRWGTHPSWSRLLGNPRLYVEIEEQLTELLGAPDSLVLPTITIIHTSMIPALAGQGAVLVDAQAHKTMYEGAAIARGAGATLHRVRTNDHDHLEQILRSLPAGEQRLVCIDGVNSMTGNVPTSRPTPASAGSTTRSCTSTTPTVSA